MSKLHISAHSMVQAVLQPSETGKALKFSAFLNGEKVEVEVSPEAYCKCGLNKKTYIYTTRPGMVRAACPYHIEKAKAWERAYVLGGAAIGIADYCGCNREVINEMMSSRDAKAERFRLAKALDHKPEQGEANQLISRSHTTLEILCELVEKHHTEDAQVVINNLEAHFEPSPHTAEGEFSATIGELTA
jgi:hypothetical protein